MKSTVINTSKEVSAISNFPPPAHFPNYMHNTYNIQYYESASKLWNYESYIRFRHQVTSVEMAPDHDLTGRWIVKYRNLVEIPEKEHIETFSGVAICIGHHNVRNMPTFKGQEKFKGRIMHTHSLKKADGFEDKTVVVVGIGNSATDAAVELSTVTKQVYISTRRGAWIFARVGAGGKPFDTIVTRRFLSALMKMLPYWLVCSFIEWQLNDRIDHEKYQLKPKHRALSAHITMNDSLPNKIICGTVKVKGDIDYFTEDGVVFKGESETTCCDAVILGTGYKVVIPFLSEDILPIERNKVRLYKYMFVPNIAHSHTLGVLGLFQTVGAGLPAGELQCRWFALLQSGARKLPSRAVMEADIDRVKREIAERYYEADRHTFQADWLPYMDELAAEIGCSPPIWKYLFTDPRLFYHLVFGVAAPYQYRLVGPHAWPGAREAILTIQDRIDEPFKTNATKKKSKFSLNSLSCSEMLIIGIIFSAIISSLMTAIFIKLIS